MSSTFGGISTAVNALMAQRQALDVTGQNIANVDTPGYTRQRADLQEMSGVGRAGLYSRAQAPGNGVMVTDVARLADALVDARQRTAHAEPGQPERRRRRRCPRSSRSSTSRARTACPAS